MFQERNERRGGTAVLPQPSKYLRDSMALLNMKSIIPRASIALRERWAEENRLKVQRERRQEYESQVKIANTKFR